MDKSIHKLTKPGCKFPECPQPHSGLGYCSGHRRQFRRGQGLRPLQRRNIPLAERFWANVKKTDTCWLWTGTLNDDGYGILRGAENTQIRAHRLSYKMLHGNIPGGAMLDHRCRNRACVNPTHLRPSTDKRNQENRTGANRNSGTGVRGVHWIKSEGRYRAQVMHHGKTWIIGRFKRLEDAEAAVIARRNELFSDNETDHSEQ